MAGTRLVYLGSLIIAALLGCAGEDIVPPAGSRLEPGTWGGENVGVLVSDSIAHVHVGCTNGYFPGPITLAAGGSFEVTGSYILRAYPVAVGPSLPARFTGSVRGRELTFTVIVNDTVEKKTVTLGPSVVTLGREPRMGPCPICSRTTIQPSSRASLGRNGDR